MTTRELKNANQKATTSDYGTVRLATDGESSGDDVVQADDTRLLAAANLAAHIADTTAAHAASAIGFTPASGIAATDVQAAIVEDAGDLAAHLADTSDAHDASAISFAPAGTIAATTVQAAIEEVASETAGGAGAAIGWFVVTAAAYGATGDGSTDDLGAINDAIADLNAAGGGVLYFPHPSVYYKVTAALDAITVPVLILGDGMGAYDVSEAGTEIRCTSATAVLFTVNAKVGKVANILLRNSHATPTAGAAVLVDGSYIGQKVDFDAVHVHGFYDGIDVKVGAQWSMVNILIVAPVRYGVRVRNTVNGDAGDWSIVNSNFYAQVRDATAALRIESSGGGKVANTKFNQGNDSPTPFRFADMVSAANPATATSILLFTNCSFENYDGNGIDITGPNWNMLVLNHCQWGQYDNATGSPVVADTVNYIIIDGAIFIGDATTPTAIDLTDCDHVRIGAGTALNFTAILTQSSCTDVTDRFDGGAATGGGGGGGGITLISEQVLGSPAATIALASIPGTYKSLLLEVTSRTSAAAVGDDVVLQANGDTGSNYGYVASLLQVAGTTPTRLDGGNTAASLFYVGPTLGSTATGDEAGLASVTIPDYAGTTFRKQLVSTVTRGSNGTNMASGTIGGEWRNTAAITSLLLFPTSGGNFVAGTAVRLYGIG